MRKKLIAVIAVLMAFHLTGCAGMADLGFPFKTEPETTQHETKETASSQADDKTKESEITQSSQPMESAEETDPIVHVETIFKSSLERYANAESMFVELSVEGDGFTQTMISVCSPETVMTAARKESGLLSTEGILLYEKDEDDWIMMTADKGDQEADVAVASVNEQMKASGYKIDASGLSGFELLTLNLAEVSFKEAKKEHGAWTAKGTIKMLGADVTAFFDESERLSQLDYRRDGEAGTYRFYAEDGPNHEKGEEVAARFVEIIKAADNCFSALVKENITGGLKDGIEESPVETDPLTRSTIQEDGVPEETGAVAGRIPAGEIPGWETNEQIQKAIKEVQGHIGETVIDAPFGCSWLEFEDGQKRYAPGEAVWVPSAFLAFTDNGDFTSEKHEVYILVKLQNNTNEDQIYTRMTIQGVREK